MSAFGQQIVIGTSPTLIFKMVTETDYKANNYTRAANPTIFIAGAAGDPLPLMLILPSTSIIYLGGSQVDSVGAETGAAITGVGSIAYNAIGGDSLYGVVASGTQTVSLLALRQDDQPLPAFALLTHKAAGSTDNNVATTAAISTLGATFITLGVVVQNGVAVVISDSASNTWEAGTRTVNAAGTDVQQFKTSSPITSATHTFTATTISGSPAIAVASFDGPSGVTLDKQSGGIVTTGTTVQPGSILPGQNNELVVSVVGYNSISSTATASGMTVLDSTGTSADAYGIGLAYKVQTTAAAINPTWTYGGSTFAAASIASFAP